MQSKDPRLNEKFVKPERKLKPWLIAIPVGVALGVIALVIVKKSKKKGGEK